MAGKIINGPTWPGLRALLGNPKTAEQRRKEEEHDIEVDYWELQKERQALAAGGKIVRNKDCIGHGEWVDCIDRDGVLIPFHGIPREFV